MRLQPATTGIEATRELVAAGRLQAANQAGVKRFRNIRAHNDTEGFETPILAAPIRSVNHVIRTGPTIV